MTPTLSFSGSQTAMARAGVTLVLWCFLHACAVHGQTTQLADIECKTKQLALKFGAARISGGVEYLERALNFADNCTHSTPDPAGVPAPSIPASGVTFYVDTAGDDTNPGTEDKPFKTLQRARDALRQAKLAADRSAWAGGTVVVGKGKHFLPDTLRLTRGDGGSPGAPVTYMAAPGQNVTLSGGIPLQLDWKSAGNNIFSAQLPQGTPYFTSLFVNGIRQVRARFPNGNPQSMSGLCYSKSQQSDEMCPGYLQASGGLLSDEWMSKFEEDIDPGKISAPSHRFRRITAAPTSQSVSVDNPNTTA